MNLKTLPPAKIANDLNKKNPQTTFTTVKLSETLSPDIVEIDAETAIEKVPLKAEGPRYNPEAIAARYGKRPLKVGKRLLQIFWNFTTFALSLWWDKKTNRVVKNELKRAVRLRQILTQLGPAFIKVGQALSTRPDLVPSIYLEELTKLQDQLPAFPNKVAYQFIEEELGAAPHQLYAELSPNPIAAASLGQVYKGKLKTGEEVAVKVQRPDLAENIALDIYILRMLASWAKKNIRKIRSDLVAIMDEFGDRIYEEMNYTQEGLNAQRFQELYGHLSEIYVPKIYWEYTGRRVLTMEWVTGTKLTDLEAIKAQGIDAKHLIEVGVQCSLRQLLEHGFFHADPHPGNLLASPDGKLVYLDFGMMSEVKPYQRYGLLEAVVHLVNRDFEGLAQDYIKLEFLTPDTDLTPIIPALANVFSNALGASVAELNFKSITDEFSALMYEYPFRVPAYYALIIRSLVTLEGIAINVDPNFKVLSKAYPYIAKRLLTDPAPQLRASLRDLLFKDGDFRWKRLENLLRNASNSDDYDIDRVLNQAVEFLFSQRGDFIRDRIVNELVNALDIWSRRTLANARTAIGEWFGWKSQPTKSLAIAPMLTNGKGHSQSVEHIKRIWEILDNTPGFDRMRIVQMLPSLLAKPEIQHMGQQVAGSLTQRAIARIIRQIIESQENAPAIALHETKALK